MKQRVERMRVRERDDSKGVEKAVAGEKLESWAAVKAKEHSSMVGGREAVAGEGGG